MFKIQDILATKKSLKMLLEGNQTSKAGKECTPSMKSETQDEHEDANKIQKLRLYSISDNESVDEGNNIDALLSVGGERRRNTKNMDKVRSLVFESIQFRF